MTITWDLFLHSALLPFHFCVMAIFLLIIAETIGIYIGHRPSNLIRDLLPRWIRNSPLLRVQISRFIILLFFLINLSYAGYFFQLSIFAITEDFVSSTWIIIPAFLMAWFFTLFMIHCLDQLLKPVQPAKYIQLIGRFATIVSGHARPGFSAQASVRDVTGRLHYVQIEPEYGELELRSQVILIGYSDSHYIAKKIVTQRSEDLSSSSRYHYD